jgi:integrase
MTRNLLLCVVNEATEKRYRKDLQKFLDWAKRRGEKALSAQEMDILLYQYFQEVFDETQSRTGLQHCRNVKAAAQLLMPALKYALPTAGAALKGWDKCSPSQQKPPVPGTVAYVLVGYFLEKSKLDLACMTLLMFEGYLRISEAANLTVADVTMPTGVRSGGLRLQKTKTGLNQSVIIRKPIVWALLQRVMRKLKPGSSRLFDASEQDYNLEMKQAWVRLGLQQFGWTPHSLRHGGASWDYLNGTSMADIIQKGRWREPNSASRYVQSGRAILLGTQLPVPIVRRGQKLLEEPSALLKIKTATP